MSKKQSRQKIGQEIVPTDEIAYECELCAASEEIPAEVIAHFDEVDPGMPGQPATFRCEHCLGIMYPQSYLRAKRAEP
jgi:uncharacterized Zn finger protein